MNIPAGWYADSTTPGQLRWWDGSQWTEHVTAGTAPVQVQADTSVQPDTSAQPDTSVQPDTSAQTVPFEAHPAPSTVAADPYAAPTSASSTTQTTQNFDYPQQPKPKRTGLWIGLGAGALVLVLVIGAGIFFVGSRVVQSVSEGLPTVDQNPVPSAPGSDDGTGAESGADGEGTSLDDISAQLMDPALPAGFAADPDSPPSGSEAASTYWNFYVDTVNPAQCVPLGALEPLVASDGTSSDVVTDLGSWLDEAGSARLTASVRQFGSTDLAAEMIETTEGTIASCGTGYSGDGFSTLSVTATGFVPSGDSESADSWIEDGANTPDGEDPFFWAYEVADIQRGDLVVRGTCFQAADAADSALCGEFFAGLAADLDAL